MEELRNRITAIECNHLPHVIRGTLALFCGMLTSYGYTVLLVQVRLYNSLTGLCQQHHPQVVPVDYSSWEYSPFTKLHCPLYFLTFIVGIIMAGFFYFANFNVFALQLLVNGITIAASGSIIFEVLEIPDQDTCRYGDAFFHGYEWGILFILWLTYVAALFGFCLIQIEEPPRIRSVSDQEIGIPMEILRWADAQNA